MSLKSLHYRATTTMSGSEDDQSKNVFLHLIARVVRKPLYQFPEQWRSETYEPRIYKALGTILRNATVEEFDSFILEFVNFTQAAHVRLDMRLYIEFINVCANIILYWVFARKRCADIVRKLMERTSVYLQAQENNLAIAWRSFTPVYSPCPLSGVTPLMFAARSRQYDILKVLLQYGMLERERRPSYVVISILFYPSSFEETLNVQSHDSVLTLVQECMTLCFRVLKYISITDIEMQIAYGHTPLLRDWRVYIPANRYQEPCELTHLCRVTVRERLLLTGGLPEAIKRLPLPTYLQHYLNLEY